MERVDLFTGPRAPDKTTFVGTVFIPEFLPDQKPEVIIWGDRAFKHAQASSPVNFTHPSYVECFVVVAHIREPAVDQKDDRGTAQQRK